MTVEPALGRSTNHQLALSQVKLIREPTALRVVSVLQMFTFASVREPTSSHRTSAERVLLHTPGMNPSTCTAIVDRLWGDYATRATVLTRVCRSMPPGWAPAIAVELATSNPLLESSALGTGAAQVRIDAILDVLDNDRSCHDIRQEWLTVMGQLNQSAQSDTERVTVRGSELLGGILGKFGSTLVEVGVEQGKNFLDDLSATHTVSVDDLARMVIAVRAGIGDLDTDLVSDIFQKLVEAEHLISRDVGQAKGRGNTSFEANRQLLLVQRTIQLIQEASGRSAGTFTESVMPDVVGMRLTDAVHLLRNLGVRSRYEVSPDPTGNVPSVRVPKNWVVTAQTPAPHHQVDCATLASLAVERFGRFGASQVTDRVRSASRL